MLSNKVDISSYRTALGVVPAIMFCSSSCIASVLLQFNFYLSHTGNVEADNVTLSGNGNGTSDPKSTGQIFAHNVRLPLLVVSGFDDISGNMEVSVGDVVLPGDSIKDVSSSNIKGKVILGPGLRRDGDIVVACKAGILRKRKPAVYYVDSYEKRYIPSRGENVVGVVTQKAGDIFKVNIGASEQASLSYLAFEGVSKKNRPDVQVGDVIFAKLLVASKDMEPELVCVDSHGKQGKLGVLSSDGMLFTCSLNLVRKILNPKCPLLAMLAKEQAYEVAVGMNGKVWIKAKSVKETIAACNAILAAEFTAPNEMQSLCRSIAQTLFKLQ